MKNNNLTLDMFHVEQTVAHIGYISTATFHVKLFSSF
jgi:hypothetical protein